MTTNQISYYRAKEEERANKATENETNRHNIVTEQETGRHNLASEQLSKYSTDITREHYERQDAETGRANRAREYETNRNNIANESLRAAELSEQSTHNRNVENETARSNRARELETNRSNIVSEAIQRRNSDRNYEVGLAGAAAQQTRADASAAQAEVQARKLAQDWLTTMRDLDLREDLNNAQISRINSQNTRDVFQNIRDLVGSVDIASDILLKEVETKYGKKNWIWKLIDTWNWSQLDKLNR